MKGYELVSKYKAVVAIGDGIIAAIEGASVAGVALTVGAPILIGIVAAVTGAAIGSYVADNLVEGVDEIVHYSYPNTRP